jgi:hypothetical protein
MPEKKVVQSGSSTPSAPRQPSTPNQPTTPSQPPQGGQPRWQPSAEGKGQANTYRIIAAVVWVLAIAGELYAIFVLLKQNPINMTFLIGAIVVIGVLAVVGDFLWKRANEMDPASEADGFRFFIQNQLGAIIGIIAFLPLIILILTNKNMNQQQKTLAGGIGVVVLAFATIMGVSINPPSVEQYTQTAMPQLVQTAQASGTVVPSFSQTALPQFPSESAAIIGYSGKDAVFWTKDGTVYHLCQQVSDLQHESKDNTIYAGTVADAHAAGKDRLTLKVTEELNQCGLKGTAPTPKP